MLQKLFTMMLLVFSLFSLGFLGMSPWFCFLRMRVSELIGYRIGLNFVKIRLFHFYYCFNSEFLILEYIILVTFLRVYCVFLLCGRLCYICSWLQCGLAGVYVVVVCSLAYPKENCSPTSTKARSVHLRTSLCNLTCYIVLVTRWQPAQ
jgi:hypothetical protein